MSLLWSEFYIYFAAHGSVPSNKMTKVYSWIQFWGTQRMFRTLEEKGQFNFANLPSICLVRIFKLGYCVTNCSSSLPSSLPAIIFSFSAPWTKNIGGFLPSKFSICAYPWSSLKIRARGPIFLSINHHRISPWQIRGWNDSQPIRGRFLSSWVIFTALGYPLLSAAACSGF